MRITSSVWSGRADGWYRSKNNVAFLLPTDLDAEILIWSQKSPFYYLVAGSLICNLMGLLTFKADGCAIERRFQIQISGGVFGSDT